MSFYDRGAGWHDPDNSVRVSESFVFRGFCHEDEPEDAESGEVAEPEPEVRAEAETWL